MECVTSSLTPDGNSTVKISLATSELLILEESPLDFGPLVSYLALPGD